MGDVALVDNLLSALSESREWFDSCAAVLLAIVSKPTAFTSARTIIDTTRSLAQVYLYILVLVFIFLIIRFENTDYQQHRDATIRIAMRLVALRDMFDGAAQVGDDALCRTFVDVVFGTNRKKKME